MNERLTVRILSAIVLLMWAACYGRCLAQQCRAQSAPMPAASECLCCHEEEPQNETPAPGPVQPCGICEYIQTGGPVPVAGVKLPAPVLPASVMPVIPDFSLRLSPGELEGRAALPLNTGPPPLLLRLEEWRAGKSLPVRGPDAVR
jgi:hypothetical protein